MFPETRREKKQREADRLATDKYAGGLSISATFTKLDAGYSLDLYGLALLLPREAKIRIELLLMTAIQRELEQVANSEIYDSERVG